MHWDRVLENILIKGINPNTAQRLIIGYLLRISSDKCQECILQNKSLLESVTDDQWRLIRKGVEKGKITLSYIEVVNQLNDHRPDVLAIIVTTDGGVPWLKKQVNDAMQKLTA